MRTLPIPVLARKVRRQAHATTCASLSLRNHATRTATVLAAAGLLVLGTATAAYADPPQHLPQNAGGYEQSFSPAYDYDTDGCYATPAIGPDGTLNPGLNTTGAVNGSCRDQSDLDNSQTYARSKCNNGWCADRLRQLLREGPGRARQRARRPPPRLRARHLLGQPGVEPGRVRDHHPAQHRQVTYPRSQVRFDGSHPKVVYHKDGPSTHFFRLANSNDEPPENHYHNWRYPPLVDWNGFPSTALRDKLMNADFGSATIKITDKDDRFRNLLNNSKPAGIPFDPWA